MKQDRVFGYLVDRICPETRLRGQDTETSLVPSQQQGPGNGKCREARRKSGHADSASTAEDNDSCPLKQVPLRTMTPIPSNKYHRGQLTPFPSNKYHRG